MIDTTVKNTIKKLSINEHNICLTKNKFLFI